VYEVKWKGNWANTYEPASCLVGWEKEMKSVDEKYSIAALMPQVNPVVEALKAREEAAKRKAEDLKKRRDRLLRLKARRARMAILGSDVDQEQEAEDDEDDELGEDDELDEDDEAIGNELNVLEEQLRMLTGAHAVTATATRAAAAAAGNDAGNRFARMRAWPRACVCLHTSGSALLLLLPRFLPGCLPRFG
jgi:hypothetical protein